MKKPMELGALVVSVLVVGGVAALGGMFSRPGEWYANLEKPGFTPPSWVFGPAWTTLYCLMAIAAWLVWRERKTVKVAPALAMFLLQLLINGAWSPLFFGAHQIAAALITILVLDIAVVMTIVRFWRVRPLAGLLLVPYLLWIGFATALNFSIWQLNS